MKVKTKMLFRSSFSNSFPRFLSSSSSSSKNNTVPLPSVAIDVDYDDPLNRTPLLSHRPLPEFLRPRVLLYDGLSLLYHRGVKWVINADEDKIIKFCCVQSRAAEPYLKACGLEEEDVLQRILFVEGLRTYSLGSTAVLRVLTYLPMPHSALSFLLMVPTPIRDIAYDHIAKHRYEWFGKAEASSVLLARELLERFIDWDELS